jgi:hypothetical protein
MKKEAFLFDLPQINNWPPVQARKSQRFNTVFYLLLQVLGLSLISGLQTASAQTNSKIQGVVLNESGAPLEQVTVTVK